MKRQYVQSIVDSVTVKDDLKVIITDVAYGEVMVEIRYKQNNGLAYRKQSFEPDFESDLKRELRLSAA